MKRLNLRLLNLRKLTIIAVAAVLVGGVFSFMLDQQAGAVAQGYQAEGELVPGMVVSFVAGSENRVERASPDTVSRVAGIVVQPSESLVAVGSTESVVFVETSGQATGYVTDLGGEIEAGDALTVSPLKGLLQKAAADEPLVATALESFTEAGQAEELTVTGEDDAQRTVRLIQLSLSLTAGAKAQANSQSGSGPLSGLEAFAESITNRDVSTWQVITAMVIFIIMLVGEGAVLYGAISSSIISLGRNPLAKDFIRRELWRTVAVALTVLFVGMASIYAVLWA